MPIISTTSELPTTTTAVPTPESVPDIIKTGAAVAIYFSAGKQDGTIGNKSLDTITAECMNLPACVSYLASDSSAYHVRSATYWIKRSISANILAYINEL